MKWAFSIKQQHCPTSIITMKGLNLTKRRAPPSCVKPIPEVVPELVKLVQRSGFMYSAFNIDEPVVVWFFPQKFWIKLEECAGALSFRHFPYESIKHYRTQMLLAINWRYWQAGKNSRLRMRVQSRFMEVRFIVILQVFAKKKVWYFSNRSRIAKIKRNFKTTPHKQKRFLDYFACAWRHNVFFFWSQGVNFTHYYICRCNIIVVIACQHVLKEGVSALFRRAGCNSRSGFRIEIEKTPNESEKEKLLFFFPKE